MITSESKALNERKAVLWVVRAVSYLVYFYLIVVEIILFIGFFLLLFGANPSSGFTQWAYRNLDRVMAPFRGIFTPIELGTTSSDVAAVFDTSIVFAMIIYGIVALALSALIGWLSGRLAQIHAAEEDLANQAEAARQEAEAQQRRQAAAAAQAAQAAGAPATVAQVTVQAATPATPAAVPPVPTAGSVPPPPPG
jgi:YGGT family